MWMRQPISMNADNQFDAPLTWSMDETDVLVICDNVKVPWEKVFVMDDAILAREIYIRTLAHCYGNHGQRSLLVQVRIDYEALQQRLRKQPVPILFQPFARPLATCPHWKQHCLV